MRSDFLVDLASLTCLFHAICQLRTRSSIGYIQTLEKEYYSSDDQADGDYVERRDAINGHCRRFPASWSQNLGFKLCCNYKISFFPGDGIRRQSLSRILC